MKKTNESDITVIIPVHELNDTTTGLLNKAIESVVGQIEQPKELLIVGPTAVTNAITKNIIPNVKFNIRVVLNEGLTDFASQVNLGVASTDTEWFSILEFDDIYATTWLKNVRLYKEENGDTDVFLPIIVNRTMENGFIGFNNEAVWAAEFSQEMGVVDNNSLVSYQGFNIDGMVMRKSVYEGHGGLKPSMKLTFIHEFLLRITYFSTRVMVIPKLGYQHIIGREDSLFEGYTKTISKDESRWWMSLAKKEYFHTKDRNITYDKQSV